MAESPPSLLKIKIRGYLDDYPGWRIPSVLTIIIEKRIIFNIRIPSAGIIRKTVLHCMNPS